MPLLLREDVPFFSMKLVYEGDRLGKAGLDGAPENGPPGWRLVWEKSFC